jgi:hypothetical protein
VNNVLVQTQAPKRPKRANKTTRAVQGPSKGRVYIGKRPLSAASSSVEVRIQSTEDVQDLVDRSNRDVDLVLKDADDEVARLENRLGMIRACLDAAKNYRNELRKKRKAT